MGIINKNKILKSLLDQHINELAAKEELEKDLIYTSIDQGTMVLLANPAHPNVNPTLIGQPASIKVNANLGTSPFINDSRVEMSKLKAAEKAGADAVMDLSTAGDLDEIRKGMLAGSGLPLGTVPIYSVAQKHIPVGEDPSHISVDEIFEEIKKQGKQGVDFMTVHCGVTKSAVEMAEESNRLLGIVSRGGSMLAKWIRVHDRENPLYEEYDRLLEIALHYNITLSLGDGMRPGAGDDAGDTAQWEEVIALSRLTKRAWDAGVQVMIEGPGHVPLNQIQAQIQGIKRLCHNAPLYVLGPLTIDTAPGYDHIGGAIGGAWAGIHGADFLCYITPAEHLTLPCEHDVHTGIIASRIAAQSAEVALGRPSALRANHDISQARMDLNWNKIEKLSIDPDLVAHRRKDFKNKDECAMCGEFCAVKILK